MIDYVVVNENNFVVGFGTVQDENLNGVSIPEGARLIPNVKVAGTQNKLKLIDGVVVSSGLPAVDKTPNMNRLENYPAIEDQVGALMKYVANQPGNKSDELNQLLNSISQTKQRFPK